MPGGSAAIAASPGNHADCHLVGLPAGLRFRLASSSWKVEYPLGRELRGVLHPGDQRRPRRTRPARSPVGRVPLLDRRSELWCCRGTHVPLNCPRSFKAGTVNKTWLAELPAAPPGTVTYPSLAQLATAKNVVAADWASAISGS